MKTIKKWFLGLILLTMGAGAYAQSTLPQNFRQQALKDFVKNGDNHELTFEEYYKFRVADFNRVSARTTFQLAVPNNTTDCGNGDFESALSTADWWGEYGSLNAADLPDFPNFSSGFLSGPITSAAARHTIVAAGVDPNVPINTTRTGTGSSMRIGNQVNGYGSEMISKRFTVTNANALTSFWYASVFQDPNHPLEAQPSFWVRVIDHTAGGVEVPGLTNLGNGTEKIYSDVNDPFFQAQGSIAYRDWSCAQINLSSLVGHNVEINFIVEDCGFGAHYGYTYIDDFCGNCTGNPTGDFDLDLKKTDSCGPGQICITYNLPTTPSGTTGVLSASVKIYQNGVQVGSLPGVSLISGSDYCWPVSQAFLDGLNQSPGGFDYVIEGDFLLSGSVIGSQSVGVTPTGIVAGNNNDYLLDCGGCWLDDQKPSSTVYKTISSSLSITTDQLWSGKYYVTDGVTISVSNAILDLTNVDIIFGECAGIVFGQNSILRANNSVFRPCDMNRTWQGFTFRGNAEGVVNESTFKNAQVALGIVDDQDANLRVVNNLFQNCRIGIGAFKTRFMEGITGNTFNVDKNSIFYKVTCNSITAADAFSGLDYQNDHWGIIAQETEFIGNISQNDFVNAQEVEGNGTSKLFYGVSLIENSAATLSDNNFTDLYRSIDLDRAFEANIENNEIEVNTYNYTNNLFSEHQIRISGANFVNVTSNEFLYAFKRQASVNWDTHSAIYAEKLGSGIISNNTITGFESAIQLQDVRNTSVKENNLADIGYCGIYINDSKAIDVMCNTINMEDDYNTISLGIYYKTSADQNPDIRFSGNCIFESSTAMLIEGSTPNRCYALPDISNNFMYNYTDYGIDARYVRGTIGSAGISYNGGRNTFASNNTTTGAIDLRALNCSISADGNYGIITTSGAVTVGSSEWYSTASCGTQLPSSASLLQRNYNETCDPIFVKNERPIDGKPGSKVLSAGFEDVVANTIDLDATIPSWFNELSNNRTENELDRLYQHLSNGNYPLNQELMDYHYAFSKANYNSAKGYLASIFDVSDEWKNLQEVKLFLAEENRQLLYSDKKLISKLQALTQDRAAYIEANQLLQTALGGHDFPFQAIPLPRKINNLDVKTLDKNKVLIYPNPTADQLNIDYYFKTEGQTTIRIVSIIGKVIKSQVVNNQSGYLNFNVSDLEKGVYIIEMRDDKGESETQRFVKM